MTNEHGEHTAIMVSGLAKTYHRVSVLEDVNFTVRRGSIFALLGANGAGKTTTVNILATLLRPDAGSARVCGYDVVQQGDKVREQISLTGQFAAVDDVLTGRENLVMIAELRRMRQPQQVARALLEQFDLTGAAHRPVATYSGGMRRRLDIAMSLVDNPPVLFLDEPTTGLDPQGRYAMWQIIQRLAQAGTTVFLTTQYLEEADHLADHIAILHTGRIVAQGTPAELKRLVPGGRLTLAFSDGTALQGARHLVTSYEPAVDEAQLSLTLTTDGSIEQMTTILTNLKRHGIRVTAFSQRVPTLDEVFLAVVGARPMQGEV